MRVGKLEAKQEVMYVGNLQVCRTKYGQFVRGKRVDLDILIAREVLKVKGFIIPYFLARYKGPDSVRKIRIRDNIISCQRGMWVKLPILIKYKIRGDKNFEVGPDGKDRAAEDTLKRQAVAEEIKRKVTVSRPKHRAPAPVVPVVITKPKEVVKPKEEKIEPDRKDKEKTPVDRLVNSVGLNDKVVGLLQGSGIYNVSQIKSVRELTGIKGIGLATARVIMNKIKE